MASLSINPTGLPWLFITGNALKSVFSSILYTSFTFDMKLNVVTFAFIMLNAVMFLFYFGGDRWRRGMFFVRMAEV